MRKPKDVPSLNLNFENNIHWTPGFDSVNGTDGFEDGYKSMGSGQQIKSKKN